MNLLSFVVFYIKIKIMSGNKNILIGVTGSVATIKLKPILEKLKEINENFNVSLSETSKIF